MSEVKLVKVDNWGIFFLQRLKHFFNRTDYCDLTLQFQDNAQLKVHRLVLSACTEYFELLERTCEMYEDCLVMPDDLQADVVVPIINFMYTGQLEFKMDLLERLYQTSLVMNMPVLTKLLDAHRSQQMHRESSHSYTTYSSAKRYTKSYEKHLSSASSSSTTGSKRSYGKAFQNDASFRKYSKQIADKSGFDVSNDLPSSMTPFDYQTPTSKKNSTSEPRPTRYELPEELESESLFDNSFTNISYTSKPLMVHPETTKRYPPRRSGIFEDPSTSKRFIHGRSTMDIVECKKISVSDQIFDDDSSEIICDDQGTYPQPMVSIKEESRDSNQLFDQILDGRPKVTIETKDNKQSNNLDHAKIISEVLKKYPHLVKSNRNIKLKILNTPAKKKSRPTNSLEEEKEKQKNKASAPTDYAYESKVLDSKEAAKLIALGAENINGPWICLICGAPGKAIHFSSYYKFRRHLVDVHNEKPVLNICEYCGHKSMKRNYLLYHLYTKHGVEPPSNYRFPKCNICNYVALTEGYLLKHKLTHPEKQYRCNVCSTTFPTSNQLLTHIQKTGHKYSADKKTNLQCIYCFKTFTREGNLYAHLRTNHKESARDDGIIDISDDEKPEIKETKVIVKSPSKQELVKYEVPVFYENEYEFDADVQYQIQQQPDGNIQVLSKKPRILLPTVKHKILNPGFGSPANKIVQKQTLVNSNTSKHNELTQNTGNSITTLSEELVIIDNDEYVMKNNHLVPKKEKTAGCEDYSMSDIIQTDIDNSVHNIIQTSTSTVEFTDNQASNSEHHKMIINKSSSINQPIQIVLSNEEGYKALMGPNHSIIFEDGDTNKTLTVLTAQHESNTIDLDNTQTNDMMIIPEGYPLNVSEAGNSSNIVVVYSHPVDDQNKEYQLITSENLEAQFVTSSAILTQNYETVTTSTTIMNSHGLQTHTHTTEDTWSNNIPQNIASNTEMEVPLSESQVLITPTESEQSIVANLDEVQLAPINSADTVEILSTTDMNQNDAELNTEPDDAAETKTSVNDVQPDIIESNETDYVETVDSLPTSNMEDDCSNNSINANSQEHTGNLSNVNPIVPQGNIRIEDISVANEIEGEEASKQQTLDDTKYIENASSEKGLEEAETIENIAREIQSTSVITPVKDEKESSSTKNTTVIKAKEQIKSLTSEWSDDEMEISTEEQSTSQHSNNFKVGESELIETDSQSELEESIENIQHEMEKQLSRAEKKIAVDESLQPLSETENVTTAMQQHTIVAQATEPGNKTVTINEISKTPVKISSLLNDWEDNDSAESETTVGTPLESENKDDIELNKEIVLTQDVENGDDIEVKIEPVQDNNGKEDIKPDPLKPKENIQSLVRDWVDDDEDEETINKSD